MKNGKGSFIFQRDFPKYKRILKVTLGANFVERT